MPRDTRTDDDHAATRCRALVAATVISAIRDLTRQPVNDEPDDIRSPALRWIMDGDRTDPFSFAWCCSVLDIDAAFAREAIRQRERDVAAAAVLAHPPVDPARTEATARILAWRRQVSCHAIHVSS